MHWECFYVHPTDVQGQEILFKEEEVKHIASAKRKKLGDIIWAVDGKGTAYQVIIRYIAKNEIKGEILKTRRRIGEPVAEVTLAQGILKGDRFDWLVEKATEIGVRRIIPFISETSVPMAGPQKINRWERVALAAMKQSNRTILPEISSAKTLTQVLSLGTNCHHRLICHRNPRSISFHKICDKYNVPSPKAIIVVGPEGGFSEKEIHLALEHGFIPISLGPRRLRAETAGTVILTLLLSNLGEME